MKNNWQTKRLSEVSLIGAGNSAPQNKKFFSGGTYPFFRTSDVGIVHVGEISKSRDLLNKSGLVGMKLHTAGTILIPKSGASTFLNHRVQMNVDGYVSSHLATILPNKKKIDQKYLFYFLTTIDVRDMMQDVKYPSLKLSDIKQIEISYPESIAEQKRIVKKLDAIFEKTSEVKENLEKNIKNSQELFESKLNYIYTKQTVDCKVTQLSELIEVKHGFAFKSEFFSDSGDYVLLTPGNFYEKGGYRDRERKQKYYTAIPPKDYILSKDSLLVVMTEQAKGLLGSPLLVPEPEKFLHNQRLGLIKFDEQKVEGKYLYYFFNTHELRESLYKSGTGVKVRHTSPDRIKANNIRLPSLLVQKKHIIRIDQLINDTRKLTRSYTAKCELIEELNMSVLNTTLLN